MNHQQTTIVVQGQCLCGAVSFKADASTQLEACHCGMCRRWGGGPAISVHCDALEFAGAEHIKIFSSSDWAERAFCRHCGSHLYYRLIPLNSYSVPVGLLSPQEQFVLTEQIYIDNKPAYYSFANKTTELTEAQVLEKFASL